ncbi:hypothetical protein E2C01_000312 [Portunus trituberculatus]|uniref:Uncharacterized protein n=1 Tax=Portunus trituberculatus TaxID=210409 RepID=A0A5B7CEL5_PORTR|nr:hypothetical protein [Portunus trituberculatus]
MKTVVLLTVCVVLAHAALHPNELTRPNPRPRPPRTQARVFPLEKAPLRMRAKQADVVIDGKGHHQAQLSSGEIPGVMVASS